MMLGLFGLEMMGALPLPLLIGAGFVLAIASNRDKRIRIMPRKQNENRVSDAESHSVRPSSSDTSQQTTAQLPDLSGRSPVTEKPPISFKIKK
ncbi:MAG: hypothetical protein AAGA75_02755 [Cyanobacteria bacterium P01_E01_bin.6]